MEHTRPYWKAIVSLVFSIIATALVVVAGVGLLRLFLPFVIGWIIASIANPLVCWLEKKLKIVKKWGSAITIIAVIACVIGLLYLAISKLVREIIDMVKAFPEMYHDIEVELETLATRFEGIIKLLPQNMKDGWNSIEANLEIALGEWIGSLSEPTVEFAGNVAKSIPSILIGVIITILASYFFVADRESVISWAKKYTPSPIQRRMTMVVSYFKHAIGGYFKAQFQIMMVLSTMLFIGFTLIDVKYAIVLAILFAFLDFLPFFGTAITLVPWAVYEVLGGDYKRAIVLLVLYVLTQ